MEKINTEHDSNKQDTFKGAIPYWADKDPVFMEFLYTRDQEVEDRMPSMHARVTKASREILRVDGYGYDEGSFRAYICPVRVRIKDEDISPILLTYCKWDKVSQMLYWPLDMIPLTNEEKEEVCNNFINDDEVYYQRSVSHTLQGA